MKAALAIFKDECPEYMTALRKQGEIGVSLESLVPEKEEVAERVDLGGVARRMEAVFEKMQEAQTLITEKRLRQASMRA